jgi:hypothetical protein
MKNVNVWLCLISLFCISYSALALDRVDQEALNNRIAALEASTITSPANLQSKFRAVAERLLPISPPDPSCPVSTSGGIVVFEPINFKTWINNYLEQAEFYGVVVYPVVVVEDPETRQTVFLNGSGTQFASIPAEQGYNPYAWLMTHQPELYAENADPDMLAWKEAIYDSARIGVVVYLLPSDSVAVFAQAQLTAASQSSVMSMQFGEEIQESPKNLVIHSIESVSNGMALGISWPELFTNKLEVFARTNLTQDGWFVISTNLSTVGTNSLWWTDTTITTSIVSRFYVVGNADLDTDQEGITDARERWIYGTDEDAADSDGDGLNDWDEIFVAGTQPWIMDTDFDGVLDGEDQYPLFHGPFISVTNPIANQTLSISNVVISGSVSNWMALTEIRVNSQRVSQQTTPTNGVVYFSHTIGFGEGLQDITVTATATNGSSSLVSYYVTVNAYPPSVLIIQPTAYQVFTNINVRVVVESDSNAANITVNGLSTIRNGYRYSAWIDLPPNNSEQIIAISTENGRSVTNKIWASCTVPVNYLTADSDGDGVQNQYDYFPDDPAESYDSDSDGVGDNSDPDPNNPSVTSTITIDTPEDGITIRVR